MLANKLMIKKMLNETLSVYSHTFLKFRLSLIYIQTNAFIKTEKIGEFESINVYKSYYFQKIPKNTFYILDTIKDEKSKE